MMNGEKDRRGYPERGVESERQDYVANLGDAMEAEEPAAALFAGIMTKLVLRQGGEDAEER